MEVYILKSAACLGILFLFYKLLLENTSLHTTKRFFLLGSLAISFIIPCITFTTYIQVNPLVTNILTEVPASTPALDTGISEATNYTLYILGGIYLLGVGIFGIRFGLNLRNVFTRVRNNSKFKQRSIVHVLLKLPVTPHSFFNYIFFSKKAYNNGEIPEEVLMHETAHVEQKHSWDIVFIELLRIAFWFNPLLYFIKHSIKLNHEFLADRTVLNQGADTASYQTILLDFSSKSSVPSMAHSINYSSSSLGKLFSKNSFGLVKKRFTVMKTHTSRRAAWLRMLVILPLMAGLIYGFSSTKTVEKIVSDPKVTFENPEVQKEYDTWYTNVANEIGNSKATPEQLAAYNKIAAFWNKRFNETPNSRIMPLSELKKLETIYRLMTIEQRKQAQPFPECKPPATSNSPSGNDAINKILVIMIQMSEITINGKQSSLKTFARDLDKLTKNWEEADYTSIKPIIKIASTPDEFLKKLDAEYKKTHFSKANGGFGLLPPPPPPPAPKVIKGVNDTDDNNPPPPPPAPDAPRVIKSVNYTDGNIPPPPPPMSQLDIIVKMAKKKSTFYYEGKEITSDEAIEVVKKNSDLNIQVTNSSSKNPTVKISKEPIYVKKKMIP